MSRRRSVMSESFKYELAKDLGFYDVVQREGWSGIRTKDAGNMVKRAIQIAEAAFGQAACVNSDTMLRLHQLTTVKPIASQPAFNGRSISPSTALINHKRSRSIIRSLTISSQAKRGSVRIIAKAIALAFFCAFVIISGWQTSKRR